MIVKGFFVFFLLLTTGIVCQAEEGELVTAPHGIRADTLGLIINASDPLSVQIGEYYQSAHKIPPSNVLTVNFPANSGNVSRQAFEAEYEKVKENTPDHIQAYALAWAKPYKVDCLSITTAFAFGFDDRFCATGCRTTRYSPYFSSTTDTPWSAHKLRPTMAVAANSFAEAKKLIDRGVQSKAQWPKETSAYVLQTSDKARSVRLLDDRGLEYLNKIPNLDVTQKKANTLKGVENLLFYFTGLTHVKGIKKNQYLPGAMADHLTSAGGVLDGTGQMSALRWLEGGATGSYGAVAEPCNYTAKFPNPGIAIEAYSRGDTLLEAYWKSVAMPGQGVFIGDPLASPWSGYKISSNDGWVTLSSRRWGKGSYLVAGGLEKGGTYDLIGTVELPANDHEITFKPSKPFRYYRVQKIVRKTTKK